MIRLCPNVSSAFAEALDKASLFSAKKDMERLRDTLEPREQPQYGKPGESCKYNLFFGFFFDGTRNNYMACEPSDPQAAATKRKEKEARKSPNCHSNVARLYDIYPGQSVPGVLAPDTDWAYKPELYKHFFKVYVPGVGTEFKQIGDTGKGLLDGTLGAAAANNGSARLVWALVQAINNVHRFFKQGAMLITADEAHRLANRTYLSASTLKRLSERGWFADSSDDGAADPARATREAFTGLLTRLHDAIRPHWPTGPDLKPARLDPGMVQKINVSVFGFSRGATKARVFVNWLQALGKLDAQLSGMSTKHAMTLGGFPFEIEFLGIFDTVASVGLANTLGNSLFGRWLDGHSAWSDAEVSLRVPSDVRCLHLVAAHEVRRSFPLDSISVNGQYDGKMQEIVLPGVHSDIGGGYAPQEQGKGLSADGEDMLSRIPLIMMYREARLSGVPLKLELASDKAKKRFALSRRTIDDFNRYLDVCKAGKPVVTQAGQTVWPSTLTDIFREQRQLYIQWRLLRRVGGALPLHETDSFKRSSTFDQNDLHSANRELENELDAFQQWLRRKGPDFVPKRQSPGFSDDHAREWEELATWWHAATPITDTAAAFFDEYVHDSRAWFKLVPGNPDSQDDMEAMLEDWHKRIQRAERASQMHHAGREMPNGDGLTDAQRQAAMEFHRTKQIPRMLTEGREPFLLAKAGYLRYRKVYAGSDRMLISNARQPKPKTPDVAAPDRPRAIA